jgi:hypothetical protein
MRNSMNGLLQHLALLSVVTTGVGAAMVQMGLNRGRLEARRRARRCPSCGRLMPAAVCDACVR